MRIDEYLAVGHKTPVSFEFFPPKNDDGWNQLYRTIDRLRLLAPAYVSVTYGAGGSTRQKTVELTGRIQNEIGLRAMSHLTCVGHTRDEIATVADQLWESGIRNVLALRGDPPRGQTVFTPIVDGFSYASDLVAFLRGRHDFCIAVAGYPEGHIQCLNRTRDLEHLKQKVDAGANLIITQLFFDNADFYRFRDQARAMGITVPIIAGIMPIISCSGVKRMVTLTGARIPHPLLQAIEAVESDAEAVRQIGTEHALRQCQDLLRNGVDGLHFYTLNQSLATREICHQLSPKVGGA
jgi:5,10-methylenetetrahydrofolate reductase, prokaryotic form